MVSEYLPYLWHGVVVTLRIFGLSFCVMLPVAFLLGLARLSRLRVLRWTSTVIVEFFRGTSALIQLFWAYYVLPYLGVDLPPFVVAVLVLGICEGCYGAEVVRGAIQEVPRGQSDAAHALGMSPLQRTWLVVIPQALLLMIPPFTNVVISLLKFTSVASLVTLLELTSRGMNVRATTGDTTAIFVILLATYLVLSLLLSTIGQALERIVARVLGGRSPDPVRVEAELQQVAA